MKISGTHWSSSDFQLSAHAVGQQAEEAATVSDAAELSASLAASTGSQNMLAGNFVQTDSEPSRYTQSILIARETENSFKSKLGSVLDLYRHMADGTDNYAEKVLAGKQAARAVESVISDQITENESARMEEEREAAQEQSEADGTASTDAGDTAAAPEPTASTDSTPVVEDDAAPDAAAAASDAAAAAQSGVEPASHDRIDIVV